MTNRAKDYIASLVWMGNVSRVRTSLTDGKNSSEGGLFERKP